MTNKHTAGDLKQMQSLPLSDKIRMTEYRIRQWYEAFDGDVYVSFSGGKDSTVLLDIARRLYPDIEAVFVNTGLEYPSVRKFALSKENVTQLRPSMNFRDVVIKYGYPIISKEVAQTVYKVKKSKSENKTVLYRMKKLDGKATDKNGNLSRYNIPQWKFLLDAPFNISHLCCDIMKENPSKRYEKETQKRPIIATMADESFLRRQVWVQNGCNAFNLKRPKSTPMSFWAENDVLTYIHENNLEIAKAYKDVVVDQKGQIDGQVNLADYLGDYRYCKFRTTGCTRTGCVFCLFGITQDLFRIYNLQQQEPKLADYVLRGGEFGEDEMWRPDNKGMGYWFVLDWLALHGINAIYENADSYREAYGNEITAKHLYKEGE